MDNKANDSMDLVNIKKEIYKARKKIDDLNNKEEKIRTSLPEGTASNVSAHAVVQFCERIRPKQFDIDALRLFMLECLARAKPSSERMGRDQTNEYFYDYNIDGKIARFLVKGGNIVTVWLKDEMESPQ